MLYRFCDSCLSLGYCQHLTASAVCTEETECRAFVFDVREFANSLRISSDFWREYLNNEYRDYPGRIMNERRREVFLNMEVFEEPYIEDWFEHNFNILPASEEAIRLRSDTRERMRVAATILRANNPHAAQFWGLRGKAANDNIRK